MARSGMSRRKYEDVTREWYAVFVVKPATMLIGLYIVAVLIQDFSGFESNLFPKIFTLVGGIPLLAWYYRKEFKK